MDLRGRKCLSHASGRVARPQEPDGGLGTLARARLIALVTGGEEREERKQSERDGQGREHGCGKTESNGEPRPLPAPLLLRLLEPPCLLFSTPTLFVVLAAPLDDGVRQNVVANLEAPALLARRRIDGAEDPALIELLEDRLGDLLRAARVAGEIGGVVDDPRPRRRHQLVQHLRRDRALLGAKRTHRVVQEPADDLLGAAEARQRCLTEHMGVPALLLGPQPRHHELEERSLDPRVLGPGVLGLLVLDDAAPRLADDDAPSLHLLDHGLDEPRLDLVRGAAVAEELVVLLDGLHDRGGRGLLVEVLDAQVAGEDVHDAAFEAVELRVRVLAKRDQEARA